MLNIFLKFLGIRKHFESDFYEKFIISIIIFILDI
jgi:hypothetical protein